MAVTIKEATRTKTEKASEKYAWIPLLAIGAFFLVLGFAGIFAGAGWIPPDYVAPVQTISGMTWSQIQSTSPAGAKYITSITGALGYAALGFGIFTITVSATAYRRGERWAWYVMLYWPLISLGVIAGALNGGAPLFAVFLILSLIGLLLPYRKFFPKK